MREELHDDSMAGARLDDPAWDDEVLPGDMPDPGPDWPPDVVPVFLWPEEPGRPCAMRPARGWRGWSRRRSTWPATSTPTTAGVCSAACRTTRWAT